MNFKFKLIALLLTVMMFLSSCSVTLDSILNAIPGLRTEQTTVTTSTTPKRTAKKTTSTTTTEKKQEEEVWNVEDHSLTKKDMVERYSLTKEEVDATLALLDTMVETAMTAETVDAIDSIYEEFEKSFYHIAQQMTVASIIYYCDMSDKVATERHLNTQDMFYSVQDKYTESCRKIYLDAPLGKEMFADWSPEEIQELLDFDPKTTQLKKEVEELQVQYNNLGTSEFTDGAAELYAQIVTKNNELAKLYGYDNYYDYATERVYGRDYKAEDLQQFKDFVIEYIVPCYDTIYGNATENIGDYLTTKVSNFMYAEFDSRELGKNYVVKYLNSLGDTNMGIAMRDVFDNKNCVFSYSLNSHPTAFQTYLYEDETPFCLFGGQKSSTTIVHEFGHYYAAFTNNDINNYDLCETHSQGNEFLFLKYCEGEMNAKMYSVIRANQLYQVYASIVASSAIDSFEQKVYSLESVEGYTSEDFDAIMKDVLVEFGGNVGIFERVDMFNYWRSVAVDNPVYYISYAISAVAAVEVFAMAEEDYEAAKVAYSKLVEGVSAEDGFLKTLTNAGFTTPFEEETFKKVSQTMKK